MMSVLSFVNYQNVFEINLRKNIAELVDEGNNKFDKIVITSITLQTLFSYCFPLFCLLYTSPSPRDLSTSRMPSSA